VPPVDGAGVVGAWPPDTAGFVSVMSSLGASPSTICSKGSRASKRLNAISSPSSTGGGRSVSDSVWVSETATAFGSVAGAATPVSPPVASVVPVPVVAGSVGTPAVSVGVLSA
jgi:hypothetical protein